MCELNSVLQCGSSGKDIIQIFSDATRTTYNAVQSNMCELAQVSRLLVPKNGIATNVDFMVCTGI